MQLVLKKQRAKEAARAKAAAAEEEAANTAYTGSSLKPGTFPHSFVFQQKVVYRGMKGCEISGLNLDGTVNLMVPGAGIRKHLQTDRLLPESTYVDPKLGDYHASATFTGKMLG